MEITTRIGCSLNCRFCPQERLIKSYCKNSRDNMIMTLETYINCLDKIPQEVDIDFSGMCEPWLNENCTNMMKYAIERGHNVNVFTTLVGMTEEDYLFLRESRLKTIVLHIPDEEGNSCFAMGEEYLRILNMALDDIIDGRLKIDAFSCHGKTDHRIVEKIEKTRVMVHRDMYDRAGNVNDEDVQKVERIKKGNLVCTYCNGGTLSKNVLLPDGTVLMCCMDYGMEFVLGNLLEDDYEEISTGEKKRLYQGMLKSQKSGNILCRSCHVSECKWKWLMEKAIRRIK